MVAGPPEAGLQQEQNIAIITDVSSTGIHWVLFHYISVEPCPGTATVTDECFSSQDTLWHISLLCSIRGIRGGSREGKVCFAKGPSPISDTELPHALTRQKHLPPLNPDIQLLSISQVLSEIHVQGLSVAVPSPATWTEQKDAVKPSWSLQFLSLTGAPHLP